MRPLRPLLSYTLSSPRTCQLASRPFQTSFAYLSEPGSSQKRSEELLYPSPPTANHSDLASFLAYADRTGLDPSSTVYVGTHYEYTVSSTLARYGVYAKRVGGASDFGIDLLGTWSLPMPQTSQQRPPIRVILQCKGGNQRTGPSLIRELEGSFAGAPVGWRGTTGVLAFLVSPKTATKGVRDSLGRSSWPMGFISCTKDGVIQQMIWNKRAEAEGLQGIEVGMRYPGSPVCAQAESEQQPEIVLTHNGKHMSLIDTRAGIHM